MSQSEEKRTTIAGFDILSKIGQGGMGAVYRARQVSMDRIVAVKILPPQFAENPQFVERFFSEAKAAGKLDHNNIVRALDVGEADGFFYFAMEYVEGESAAARLLRGELFDPLEALHVGEQIAQALDHAWRRGIIHRDIKPGNILVNRHGVAKLADFGLARVVAAPTEEQARQRAEGTPLYISPEQARADPDVDIRSDIYSLGATLYHMLCGAPPFSGKSDAEIMRQHLSVPPVPVHEREPDVPPILSDVIQKMLAKVPADRFETPSELADALALVRQELADQKARQATGATRHGRRAAIAITAIAASIAAIIGTFILIAHVLGPRELAPQEPTPEPTPVEIALATPEAEISPPPSVPTPLPVETSEAQPVEALFARQAVEFKRVDDQSRALINDGKLLEALACLKSFPEDLMDGYTEQKLLVLKKEILNAVSIKLSDTLERINRLAADGKLDEAAAELARLKPQTPEELSALFEETAAKVNSAITEREQERRQVVLERYHRALLAGFSSLAERRFDDALKQFDQALKDPELESIRELIVYDRSLCEDAIGLFRAVEDTARASIGRTMKIRSYNGKVSQVKDGTIYLKSDQAELGLKILTLPTDEIIRLSAPFENEPDPAWFLGAATLARAEGDTATADSLLDKGRQNGVDTARAVLRFRALTEAKAEGLYDQLASIAAKNDWPAVSQAVDQLRNQYGQAAVVRKNDAALSQYKLRARLGGHRVEDCFHGRVTVLDDEQIELVYDFATEEQFKDWAWDKPAGSSEASVKWSPGKVDLFCSGYREMWYKRREGAPMLLLPLFLKSDNWAVEADLSVDGTNAYSTGLVLWDGDALALCAGFSSTNKKPELILSGAISNNPAYVNPTGYKGYTHIVLSLTVTPNRYQYSFRRPEEPDKRSLGSVNTRDRFTYIGFLSRTKGEECSSTLTIRRVRLVGAPDPEWFRRAPGLTPNSRLE